MRIVDVQIEERIVGGAGKAVRVVAGMSSKVQTVALVVIEQVKTVEWVVREVAQWDTEECSLTGKDRVRFGRSSLAGTKSCSQCYHPKLGGYRSWIQ
jgi:hypothetical protein